MLTDSLRDATPQLRRTLDGVAALSRSINANDEALGQLLARAKSVTKVLADRAGQVNQLIIDGNLLFAALDERRAALSSLIAGIDEVSEQISGFVADNRREFGPALRKLNLVLDNLLERREHISEALRRLPPYATALGESVGSGSGFSVNLPNAVPNNTQAGAATGPLLPTGQDSRQPGRSPARIHQRATDHKAEVAMSRSLRYGLITALVVALIGGIYLVWPRVTTYRVVGYFASAVGLYPGDDVRVVGVPVGSIESISPEADAVKITMTVQDSVKLPADARAVIVAPNIVSARFIQLTPPYKQGPAMEDGGRIGLDRTAVPVEWDDVKSELTAAQPAARTAGGPGSGPVERVHQPGRRYLRRQRRLVPASVTRVVADCGATG